MCRAKSELSQEHYKHERLGLCSKTQRAQQNSHHSVQALNVTSELNQVNNERTPRTLPIRVSAGVGMLLARPNDDGHCKDVHRLGLLLKRMSELNNEESGTYLAHLHLHQGWHAFGLAQ